MPHKRMKEILQNNVANVRRFQSWMRENGVLIAKASVSKKNTSYQIYASSSADDDMGDVVQMRLDPETGNHEMETMSPADAFSQIIIMSLRTDEMLGDMIKNGSFGLSLHPVGPLSVDSAVASTFSGGARLH